MSHEDRIKQIQNGLKIIELVDEIRANNQPKPTYGRSAIGLPSTKERANAWELFHQVATDADGHEERLDQKRNDNTENRNERGSEHDDDDIPGRGERTFKESKWDDTDNIIFENSLATDIQQNDSRRESTNWFSNNKDDDRKCDNSSRGRQGDGRPQNDKADMSSLLQSELSSDRDAKRSGQAAKSTMNPNAQEYIPKHLIIGSKQAENMDPKSQQNKPGNSMRPTKPPPSLPPAKPGMQKKIMDSDKYPEYREISSPPPVPKKRGCITGIKSKNTDPLDVDEVIIEEDEDDQVVPSSSDDDLGGLERNLPLSSSQETLFQISDYESDNQRRNNFTKKTPSQILDDDSKQSRNPKKEGETKSENKGPNNGNDKKDRKEGRKLRALQQTKAGITDAQNPSDPSLGDIKKGTEGSTVSIGMDPKFKSKNGAIQHAPVYDQKPSEKTALATSAQQNALKKGAQGLSTPLDQHDRKFSFESEPQTPSGSSISFDDYFEKLTSSMKTDDLLKEIYRNQLDILTKITEKESLMNVIKSMQNTQKMTNSKIESLERNIGKLGLAVSSMEQMIASMRIMIPGKPEDNDNRNKPKNPLLKPVIARQTLRAEEVIDINPDLTDLSKSSIKKKLFIEPIDDSKTNASQFIPENDNSTINTLYALVTNRIKDKELKEAFLYALKKVQTKDEIEILYTNIIKAVRAGL